MYDDLRRNVRKTSFVLLGLLIVLMIYVSYIQVIESDFLAGNALNRRYIEAAERIERGRIVDRNGVSLAYSRQDDSGRYQRCYPYGSIAAHVVGYCSEKYGTSGAENTFNGYLSGATNAQRFLGPIVNLWSNKAGNNVVLTIDADVQAAAYRALGNHRGAVVVLDPRTGAILAMVSKPSFDPATIDSDWDSIADAENSPLVNRAVQGLYPPGSTIKVMIADAALTENVTDLKKTYLCEGVLKIGPDYELTESNHEAHGRVNLEEALTVSCNVTFGTIGLELGDSRMAKTFERYGFTKPLDDELSEATSRLPDFSRLGDGDLAQTAIGQGSLLVTPLRMAMLAEVFANKGVMMEPYIVSKIVATDGSILRRFAPEEFITPTSPEQAQLIGRMMESVVNEGTGYAAQLPDVQVAGKTGTAENPHGAPHAWFIGFAPADDPQVVVAVIVENAGTGGEFAAPIARRVMAAVLSKGGESHD